MYGQSENILAAAAELNKQILVSPEYIEYIKARESLGEFPEYKEMADSFRKKQMTHEIQKINGDNIDTDELALANDYADICLITVCNDFFQAELKLLSLIKLVFNRICDSVEVEI